MQHKLLFEFFTDFLHFPLWWYTKGLLFFIKRLFDLFEEANIILAPGLWIKNIFVPMYGQYDWQGRIVSFFIRLFNFIFRSLALALWAALLFAILTLWVAAPPIIIIMFFRSLI